MAEFDLAGIPARLDSLSTSPRPAFSLDALRREGLSTETGAIWRVRVEGHQLEGHHLEGHVLVSHGALRFALALPPGTPVLNSGEVVNLKVVQGLPDLLLGLMLSGQGRPGNLVLAGTPLPPDLIMRQLMAFIDAPALKILMEHIVPLASGAGPFASLLKQTACASGLGYEAMLAAWRRGEMNRQQLLSQPQMRLATFRPETLTLPRHAPVLPEAPRDPQLAALLDQLYPLTSPLRLLIERQLQVLWEQKLVFPLFGWDIPVHITLEQYNGLPPEPPPAPRLWSLRMEWHDGWLGELAARLISRNDGVVIQLAADRASTRSRLGEGRAGFAVRLAEHGLQLQGWLVSERLPGESIARRVPSLPTAHPAAISLMGEARRAGFVVHDSAELMTLLLQLDWRRLLPDSLCLAAGLLLDWTQGLPSR